MKKRPPLAEMHKDLNFDIDNVETEAKEAKSDAKKDYSMNTFVELPISQIELEKNIRDTYVDDSLEELGDSIIENGQIQPIVVTPKNGKYVVKVGHRRYKACLLRDVKTIKCIIENDFDSEKDRIIIQAIENEQRLNLSSREREAYIAQLIDLGMNQNEIAKALHKTKGWVSEALRSYKFVNENKELLDELSEEPSTRDTWKASTLTKKQLENVISEAIKQGGTKEAFKKEVSKRYNQNVAAKTKTSTQVHSLAFTVQVDYDNKIISPEVIKYYDEELAELVLRDIKNYYIDKGFGVQ